MVKRLLTLALLAITTLCLGCTSGESAPGRLYQTATISSLMQGVYDGGMTFSDLKWQGDFGLGTFDQLDGEMILLDGRFYQARADGQILPVDRFTTTPFSTVTFFSATRTEEWNQPLGFDAVQQKLDALMPSRNIPYAIRIDGEFDAVRTRSVPRQSKPYRPMIEIVKDQREFQMDRVSGTIVGFWIPQYMNGLNVPGYHFHFISSDRTHGGHVLDCRPRRVHVQIEDLTRIDVQLPPGEFRRANLNQTSSEDLEKVEKQSKK